MNDFEAFLDALQDDNETMLSRLGSSRSLYAETHGELETEPVLRAAAQAERAASETFAQWAEDESDPDARAFFERVAAQERGHYDTILDIGVSDEASVDPSRVHEYLRQLEDTDERIGGFVGRCLVSKRSKTQTVGFFVGNADPQMADVFRGFGTDLDEQLTDAAELFDTVCEDEESWARATEAAETAIEAAYDEYVENLEAQGLKPKPVC